MADGLSVFLVEDEALIRMMIADMVEELGHHIVAEADNVRDASAFAMTAQYDFAILDINLMGVYVDPVADLIERRGKAIPVRHRLRAGITAVLAPAQADPAQADSDGPAQDHDRLAVSGRGRQSTALIQGATLTLSTMTTSSTKMAAPTGAAIWDGRSVSISHEAGAEVDAVRHQAERGEQSGAAEDDNGFKRIVG